MSEAGIESWLRTNISPTTEFQMEDVFCRNVLRGKIFWMETGICLTWRRRLREL